MPVVASSVAGLAARHAFAVAFGVLASLSLVLIFRYPALPCADEAAIAYSGVVFHSLRVGDGAYQGWHGLRPFVLSHASFYWLYHALLHVLGAVAVMKVLVAAAVLGLPLALRAFFRALGRSEWLALGGFGVAFNALLAGGYVPFVLGMPVWVLCLALVEAHARAPRRRHLIALFALLAVTPVFHFLLAPLTFGAAAVLAVLATVDRRRLLAQLGVMFAAGLAAVALTLPAATGMRLPAKLSDVIMDEPIASRLRHLVSLTTLGWTKTGADRFSAAALVIAVAATLILSFRRVPRAGGVRAWRLSILAALLFVAYLIAPWHLAWPWVTWGTAARIPALLALLLLGSSRFVPARPADILRVAPPALFSLAHLLALAGPFFAYGRAARPVVAMAAHLTPGSAVLTAVLRDHGVDGAPEFATHAARHVAKWAPAIARAYQPGNFCAGGYHPVSCRRALPQVELRALPPGAAAALAPFDAVVLFANGPDPEAKRAEATLRAGGFVVEATVERWSVWKKGPPPGR